MLAEIEPIDAELDAAEREFWTHLAPPPAPRSLPVFASSLVVTEGSHKGPLDIARHPAQFETVKAVDAGSFQRFVVVGPTQDGKTLISLIVPTLYALLELQVPVVYGAPDMRMCQDTWTEKIKPMILGSNLGHFLPHDGATSGGGTNATTIRFHGGGTLFFVGTGGKNESAQASRTACSRTRWTAGRRACFRWSTAARTSSRSRHGASRRRRSRTTSIRASCCATTTAPAAGCTSAVRTSHAGRTRRWNG